MCKNTGKVDRILRIIGAVIISLLLVMGKISGWLAVVLGIVALGWLITGIIGWCPVYVPFKICTIKGCECKKK